MYKSNQGVRTLISKSYYVASADGNDHDFSFQLQTVTQGR